MTHYRFYVTLGFEYANIGITVVIDSDDADDAIEQALTAIADNGITHPEPSSTSAELLDILEEA